MEVETKNSPTTYRQLATLVTLVFVGMLASCKSTSNIYESDSRGISAVRQDIIKDARSLIGATYEYAGKGPRKFDCSGLVDYVYGRSSIDVGGSAATLADGGQKISLRELRPGDLVFYKRDGRVFHVSIVSRTVGDQIWVVHSTTSRGVIEEDILASRYWRPLIHKAVSLSSYR